MNKQQIIGLVLFVLGTVVAVNAAFVRSALGDLPSSAREMGEQMVAHLPKECPTPSEELEVGGVLGWILGSKIEEGDQKFAEVCEDFKAKVGAIPGQIETSVGAQIREARGTLFNLLVGGVILLLVGLALLWRKPE